MSHLIDESKHPKYDFQVERLAFFSDAVFAIAITLLVIEFKVPHITPDSTYNEVLHELGQMKFQLIGTGLSFLLIAVCWVRHHILFKYIHNYNKEILRASLFLLFPVILFPFTTAFYTETSHNTKIITLGIQVFLINNIAIALATYYLYWLVTKKYPEMSYPMSKEDSYVFSHKLVFISSIMLLIFVLSFFGVEYAGAGALPIVGYIFYKKYLERKTTKNKKQNAR